VVEALGPLRSELEEELELVLASPIGAVQLIFALDSGVCQTESSKRFESCFYGHKISFCRKRKSAPWGAPC